MNVNLLIDAMVRQTTVLIAQMATTATALRERVEAYNVARRMPEEGTKRVIFYTGQTVIGLDEEGIE